MSKFSIQAGQKFRRNGLPFIVISRDSDTVVVENAVKGRREVLSAYDMEIKFLNGDLVAFVEAGTSSDSEVSLVGMLNQKDRNEFERRCAYVNKLLELSAGTHLKNHLKSAILEVALAIRDPRPPSEPTLYRWANKWRKGGENLAALVPKNNQRGPQSIHMRADAQVILRAVLDEHYLVRTAPTLKSVLPMVVEAFTNYNKSRDETAQCEIPSRSTVYRFIQQLDAYEVMLKREGKFKADHHFKYIGKGLEAEAPLDLVRIDHTPLDMNVLSPIANIVARPTLTLATDVRSRMPLGFYVGFAAPGYEALMQCLHAAILPKDKLLERFPTIRNNWPCHGIPRMVSFDNGMEFHSNHLKDTCSMLGISMMFSPKRSPQHNGIAERFFGTINQGLLTMLDGKTFSNIMQKGDYNSVDEAVIPFKVFETVLYKWFVDVYSRDFHEGIQDFPIDAWERGVKKYPVNLPQKLDDLLILVSKVEYRTLTNRGVEIHTIKYNSIDLTAYFRRLGRKQKVKLKVNPMDLGAVHVFDEKNQSFIKVPALDERYHGVSEYQHRLARQLVTVRRKQGEANYDIGDALREIGAYIKATSSKGKKKSHRRIARYSSYDERNKANGLAKIRSDAKTVQPQETDFDGMDISELLDAAASAGWNNLNNMGDE